MEPVNNVILLINVLYVVPYNISVEPLSFVLFFCQRNYRVFVRFS